MKLFKEKMPPGLKICNWRGGIWYMEKDYEKDKIKIKEEDGRVTYYSPTTKTHIIEYKGEFQPDIDLGRTADWIIRKFRGNITIIEIVSYGLALIFYLLYTVILLLGVSFIETENGWIALAGIIMALFCVDLSFKFSKIRSYYQDTKCGKCGKYLACKESELPDIKELSMPEAYSITETRYWKCKFCDYETIRRYERHPTKKGKKNKYKMKCGKCELNEAREYKKPDIVEIGDTIYTTRYYKCEHCGYEETRTESEQIRYSFDYV